LPRLIAPRTVANALAIGSFAVMWLVLDMRKPYRSF
jgi:hypothetical protein